MKFNRNLRLSGLLVLATLISGVAVEANAQTRRRTKPRIVKRTTVTRTTAAPRVPLYRVESGEKIRVRAEDELSSKTARIGDRFETRVTEPVYATNGSVVIPVGSTVIGKVDSVRAAKKGGDPGTISVSFVQVRLPNGATRSINGSLSNLDTKKAKSDSEGAASGDDRKNDKVIYGGGGAAGGAVLGGAIGGGKGALIGAILGGVGGIATERLTKGEDATIQSGTEFGVLLNQSISMPKYAEN